MSTGYLQASNFFLFSDLRAEAQGTLKWVLGPFRPQRAVRSHRAIWATSQLRRSYRMHGDSWRVQAKRYREGTQVRVVELSHDQIEPREAALLPGAAEREKQAKRAGAWPALPAHPKLFSLPTICLRDQYRAATGAEPQLKR
jgi:hypothetical protein